MANNCYNWVHFTGSEESIKKLHDKFNDYKNFNYFTDWGNHVLDITNDTNEKTFDWCYKYGTKWWDFDIERPDIDELIVIGDTAWSPPEQLMEEICKHYDIQCRIEFEEGGNDFGGYAEFNPEGKIDEYNVSYRQWRYEQDPHCAIDDILNSLEYCDFTLEDFEDDFEYMSDADIDYIKESYNELKQHQ